METKQKNEVTNFMLYIYNRWTLDEAVKLFGTNIGAHIYTKYLHRNDVLYWYSELDETCRQKIVDRANEIYGESE